MTNETELREKLRKIEALFAGATTTGEHNAAQAALNRIKDKLSQLGSTTNVELRLSLDNPWSRTLMIALCRRYGINPYRYRGQRRTTVMIKAPRHFLDETLLPEFKALNKVLTRYLNDITERIIHTEIHSDTTDAHEIEPSRLCYE